jgi:hypothetical protein
MGCTVGMLVAVIWGAKWLWHYTDFALNALEGEAVVQAYVPRQRSLLGQHRIPLHYHVILVGDERREVLLSFEKPPGHKFMLEYVPGKAQLCRLPGMWSQPLLMILAMSMLGVVSFTYHRRHCRRK